MMGVTARQTLSWRDPMDVAFGLRDLDGLVCLLTGGTNAGRSIVAAEPSETTERVTGPDIFGSLAVQKTPGHRVGLASYDAGARVATGERPRVWPDLIVATYPSVLLFDTGSLTVEAVGHGETLADARERRDRAIEWWSLANEPGNPAPPSTPPVPDADDQVYRWAVSDVVSRIGSGELFQANIARGWSGGLKNGAQPFDVFLRLGVAAPAPYAAFVRWGMRALVSNSPELFLAHDPTDRRIETRPIKGTRARGATPKTDETARATLLASEKDRAENLMIVDLMRNDLSRICEPGSVTVETLFAVESHPGVHHLVSTVSGKTLAGAGPGKILAECFPPGSITGAPKHQAMKVIALHEPPRGAWCGTLFHVDEVGGMTASVLIRTLTFEVSDGRWRWRGLAGAGIVADSSPQAELEETEIKFRALRAALVGDAA